MSTINPAMPSAVQSYAPQQQPAVNQKSERENLQTEPTSSSAGNSTVTLSSVEARSPVNDYADLDPSRRVNDVRPSENTTIERNDTTEAELTYSSNLQLRSNATEQNPAEKPAIEV